MTVFCEVVIGDIGDIGDGMSRFNMFIYTQVRG